jgi:hypothetical protein
MLIVLPFCVRDRMFFWFWPRRVIALALGLGIMMVGWMTSCVIDILVAWFIWIFLTSNSLILQVFSGYLCHKSRVAFCNQAGGYCCWMDSGDWWVFCHSFLLFEVCIEQSTEGLLGWVTKAVAGLFN